MAYYADVNKVFFVVDTVHNPPVTNADSPLICRSFEFSDAGRSRLINQ